MLCTVRPEKFNPYVHYSISPRSGWLEWRHLPHPRRSCQLQYWSFPQCPESVCIHLDIKIYIFRNKLLQEKEIYLSENMTRGKIGNFATLQEFTKWFGRFTASECSIKLVHQEDSILQPVKMKLTWIENVTEVHKFRWRWQWEEYCKG